MIGGGTGKLLKGKGTHNGAEGAGAVAKGLRWSNTAMLNSSMRSEGSVGGGGSDNDTMPPTDFHLPPGANKSTTPPKDLHDADEIYLSPFVTVTVNTISEKLQQTLLISAAATTKESTPQESATPLTASSLTTVACDYLASTYRVDHGQEGNVVKSTRLSERQRGNSPTGDVSQQRDSPLGGAITADAEKRQSLERKPDRVGQSEKSLSRSTSRGSLTRLLSRSFTPGIDSHDIAGYVPSAGMPVRYVPSPKETPKATPMTSPRPLTHDSNP